MTSEQADPAAAGAASDASGANRAAAGASGTAAAASDASGANRAAAAASGADRSAAAASDADRSAAAGLPLAARTNPLARTRAIFDRREEPVRDLASQAAAVAAACYQMALRFHRGGKLLVFGTGGASTDAQHVAVEFVHPVIVGKRALPAISLTTDVATVTGIAAVSGMAAIFSHQLRYLGEPDDIALGISADGNCQSVLSGLRTARDLGMLTIALAGGDGGTIRQSGYADHLLIARSADPRIVKELQVTTYHVLWELVHVFFEQPGVFAPGVVA